MVIVKRLPQQAGHIMLDHALETDGRERPMLPRRCRRLPVADGTAVDVGQSARKKLVVQTGEHPQTVGVAHRIIRHEILPESQQIALYHRIIGTGRPRFHKRERGKVSDLLANNQRRLGSMCRFTVPRMVIAEAQQPALLIPTARHRAYCLNP